MRKRSIWKKTLEHTTMENRETVNTTLPDWFKQHFSVFHQSKKAKISERQAYIYSKIKAMIKIYYMINIYQYLNTCLLIVP